MVTVEVALQPQASLKLALRWVFSLETRLLGAARSRLRGANRQGTGNLRESSAPRGNRVAVHSFEDIFFYFNAFFKKIS